MNKVLIITGPTGTGKTKLSIAIAKKYQTEIINGDAFQVYKGMDILTAKIKPSEKENIPHHLFDTEDTSSEFNVAKYQTLVRGLIDEFIDKKMLPLVVGGSGLYINSIIYDYKFEKTKEVSNSFDSLTNEELHKMLEDLNSDAAIKIHMNNRRRVIRAIELLQNDAYVEKFNDTLVYDALVIYLNEERCKLYENLNLRVEEMIKEGLLEEVETLLKKPLSKTAQSAIGLKEFIPYFNQEITIEEAIDEVKKNTRHLAKRQNTWFKKQKNIKILDINRSNFNETIEKAYNLIDEWLKK